MARAGLTLAVAESLTGGALAAAVVDVPGASRVLRGGVVAYATDLKSSLLGVDRGLLARRGPVDRDVALAMAHGVRRSLGADVGVATTGVAGPDPQDGVEPGIVHLALDAPWGSHHELVHLVGDRAAVRRCAVDRALELVLGRVTG
nr:CinA family protein [Paraoerskovia sediminicola]